MNKNVVLFDFDGVIVDSFESVFEVVKTICPHLTADQFRACFEGNIFGWQNIIAGHTVACRYDVDFSSEYAPRMKHVAMTEGMREVIRELNNLYTLIIVSSNASDPIRLYMERYGMASSFAEIMGNDVHKSKAEKIKMIFSKYGADEKKYVFVTDTLGDMKEAEKLNVGTIGVTWGYHSPDVLLRGDPFTLVESPENISAAVSGYFKKLAVL